jgi:hypothetical protein
MVLEILPGDEKVRVDFGYRDTGAMWVPIFLGVEGLPRKYILSLARPSQCEADSSPRRLRGCINRSSRGSLSKRH